MIKQFGAIISAFGVAISLILVFVDIPIEKRIPVGLGLIVALLVVYIVMWGVANKRSHRKLYINGSVVEIKLGDIFTTPGLKAIALNEFFDTQVDEELVASTTINGQFLKEKVSDIEELEQLINDDGHLKANIIEKNAVRKSGKTTRYKLGAATLYNQEYILTAFSRFDAQNKAYLTMKEYLEFLMNFWDSADRVYAGRSIVIPLFGSGITRFRDNGEITDQELLEILIWSFKLSRINIAHPAQITILISPDKRDKINFYELNVRH